MLAWVLWSVHAGEAVSVANKPPSWVPESLREWIPWVLHGREDWVAPPRWDDYAQRRSVWPGAFVLEAGPAEARFVLEVQVFAEAWVQLPGEPAFWPQDVKVNGQAWPVIARSDRPAVRLGPGQWRLEGRIPWSSLPARLRVPTDPGVVQLHVMGETVPVPAWDAEGWLWFRRPPEAPAGLNEPQANYVAADWFGMFEDGNPQWLRVEVQLSVAGQVREEKLGDVLPEGWQLAAVRSPIPVLVEQGRLRAHVRPGFWTVELDAFRYGLSNEIRFPSGARVPGAPVLVGLKTRPEIRVVELRGGEQVDVSQTRFPDRWRGLPVYRWDPAQPLEVLERQRGDAAGPSPQFCVRRQWWLDEDGRGLTFLDHLSAQGFKVWRVDAVRESELGSVRVNDQIQLLTRDPETGQPGFEIRQRDFAAEAVGRIRLEGRVSGSGWVLPADRLETTLHLPVGWRVLAVLGPDSVAGDWIRCWTLLDFFAVLLLALVVQQLLGWRAGGLALITGILIRHETLAPTWTWWGVVTLIALLRLVRTRRAGLFLGGLFVLAGLALALHAVVFAGQQLRKAMHPQLEFPVRNVEPLKEAPDLAEAPLPVAEAAPEDRAIGRPVRQEALLALQMAARPATESVQKGVEPNLGLDPAAKLQTGPGIPQWRWRSVRWQWNGPVQPEETVWLWLLPPWMERCWAVLRALLTLGLTGILLRAGVLPWRLPGTGGAVGQGSGQVASTGGALGAAVWLLICGGVPPAQAGEFPPSALLNELRERLLAAPPAFPGAAEIPSAALVLSNHYVTLEARIHAAARCAVPLPARLAQWSPVRVWLNGKSVATLRREDGSLWLVVEPGVHEARVEGWLLPVDEWVWSFQLRPRKVEVQAPGWTVAGIGPEGAPGEQIFFRKKAREGELESTSSIAYDQQPLVPAFQTVRELELGLRWKVRTTVRRLSPPGRPAVLSVPTLPGEQILTGGLVVREGCVEVRFAPSQTEFVWDSELPHTNQVVLTSGTTDPWAEEWRLQVGQLWNVAFHGPAPVYEAGSALCPTWYPWPGEAMRLEIRRPSALSGQTVTVESVLQTTQVGHRLQSTELALQILSSLGQDFVVQLPEAAEITALSRNGEALPVQKVGRQLTIPLLPGRQEVTLAWKEAIPMQLCIRPSEVRLPVEASNVRQTVSLPSDRWVLTTRGPRLGPAVQFWSVMALAALLGVILSWIRVGPMGHVSWFLLLLGLTQVPIAVAWIVVTWFAAFQWRGSQNLQRHRWWLADVVQIVLVVHTVGALAVLYAAVEAGLLGRVEMFVAGNGSSTWLHHWFTPRCEAVLPRPEVWAVSLWWYRFAMLAWAVWLALAWLRWLHWGWKQFSAGGCWIWPQCAPTEPKPPTPPRV